MGLPKLALVLVVIFAFAHGVLAKSYKNHRVVSFRIENENQLKEIQALEREPGFTFWDPPTHVNTKLELVVRSEQYPIFEEIALATKIEFKVSTNDLQSMMDAEKPLKQRKEGFSLDQYNELENIYQFLDETSQAYPGKVTVFTVGETFEGRLIQGLKIETNASNPAIFIESNIHAREWISSATSLWIINEILTLNDPQLREIVDGVTFYFVPIINPDGYKYTHDVDRLWRKTRSNHNILCPGTDANRNFGFNFREGGSSKIPCTITYSGPEAFSEKETRALRDFYATISNKTELYLCFHSAAKLFMYPFGNTLSTELVPNIAHLEEIAQTAAEAISQRYDTIYQYGNAMQTLYVTSGSSRDHMYGFFKTPLVFTYEMREGEESIFILPPEQIQPNSEEIFDSLIAIIKKSKELGYFQLKN